MMTQFLPCPPWLSPLTGPFLTQHLFTNRFPSCFCQTSHSTHWIQLVMPTWVGVWGHTLDQGQPIKGHIPKSNRLFSLPWRTLTSNSSSPRGRALRTLAPPHPCWILFRSDSSYHRCFESRRHCFKSVLSSL